jgi:nucleoside 2-deoxyribosyltransferase
MPQTAIRGVYRNGKIIPQEDIPFTEDMNVIIVFTKEYDKDEARYYELGWQVAERKASEDYRSGNIKSAESIDEMFDEIERNRIIRVICEICGLNLFSLFNRGEMRSIFNWYDKPEIIGEYLA